MNAMVKSRINKCPSVKLGIWNLQEGERNNFLLELPENIDVAEKYAHDFNEFFHQKRIYTVGLTYF